jgi:hypothetical protein
MHRGGRLHVKTAFIYKKSTRSKKCCGRLQG